MMIFVLLFAEIDNLRSQLNNQGKEGINEIHTSYTKVSNHQIKNENSSYQNSISSFQNKFDHNVNDKKSSAILYDSHKSFHISPNNDQSKFESFNHSNYAEHFNKKKIEIPDSHKSYSNNNPGFKESTYSSSYHYKN